MEGRRAMVRKASDSATSFIRGREGVATTTGDAAMEGRRRASFIRRHHRDNGAGRETDGEIVVTDGRRTSIR